jgi:hypothetical protein
MDTDLFGGLDQADPEWSFPPVIDVPCIDSLKHIQDGGYTHEPVIIGQ